jgi:hypothetical protein
LRHLRNAEGLARAEQGEADPGPLIDETKIGGASAPLVDPTNDLSASIPSFYPFTERLGNEVLPVHACACDVADEFEVAEMAAWAGGVFVDEQPDATRIYVRFGVNLPRAGYLARLRRAHDRRTRPRSSFRALRRVLFPKISVLRAEL